MQLPVTWQLGILVRSMKTRVLWQQRNVRYNVASKEDPIACWKPTSVTCSRGKQKAHLVSVCSPLGSPLSMTLQDGGGGLVPVSKDFEQTTLASVSLFNQHLSHSSSQSNLDPVTCAYINPIISVARPLRASNEERKKQNSLQGIKDVYTVLGPYGDIPQ